MKKRGSTTKILSIFIGSQVYTILEKLVHQNEILSKELHQEQFQVEIDI